MKYKLSNEILDKISQWKEENRSRAWIAKQLNISDTTAKRWFPDYRSIKHNPNIYKEAGFIVGKTKHEIKLNRIDNAPFDILFQKEKRQRILNEQSNKCGICNCDPIWNNMELKFELDHISGDRNDESRQNLRMVCPNCHSQTDTYKVKNACGIKRSEEEIVNALLTNDSVYHALQSLNMNPHGGNYVRIRGIVKKNNLKLPYLLG